MSPAAASKFDRSVFVNCPFDEDFQPIMEAILFCVIDCGLRPRIATERIDSGEARIEKIIDLSRVRATSEGEFARLNMPFELGVDYGFQRSGTFPSKRLLVIASDQYLYQRALSDIAGWDIRSHGDDFEQAIREVRRWVVSLGLTKVAAGHIIGDYLGYQQWDYERLYSDRWNERDIRDRQTSEIVDAMFEWVDAGRPGAVGRIGS